MRRYKDDVSYVDNLLKPIRGNMEDVVPMDRLKDNGVLEEVPKERLSTMDKKPGTYDSVI